MPSTVSEVNKRLFLGFLIALLTATLSSCSILNSGASGKPPESINVWTSFEYSRDPLAAKNSEQFFLSSLENRTLFNLSESGKLIDGLAKGHETSEDGLVVTVTISKNTFSDNSKITSSDIKATLSRVMKLGGEYSNLLKNVQGNGEAKSGADFFGIKTPDTATIEFNLVKPDPFFVYVLAHPSLGIIPSTAIGINGELQSSVHSGLYSTDSIVNTIDGTTVFKPRDKGLPVINVTKKTTDDLAKRPPSDGVDVVLGEATKSSSFTQVSVPQLALASWNIYVNDQTSPFSDIRFRKAVLIAMDEKESIDPYSTKAISPKGFTGDTFDSVDCEKVCATDKQEAKDLLKEIYPNGSYPEITIDIEDNVIQQALAKSAVSKLNDIGIKATVSAHTPEDLSNEIARGQVQLFRFGWVSSIAVGANPLVQNFKADSTENVTGIADADLEDAIAKFETAASFKSRLKESVRIQERIKELWLMRPVAHFHKIVTVSKDLKSYEFDFYGRVDFAKIRLSK